MGMFKSKEEKQREKEEKALQLLEQYGLGDMTNPEDLNRIKFICNLKASTDMMSFGASLGGDVKSWAMVDANYNQILVEQNMLIIRMLNELLKK